MTIPSDVQDAHAKFQQADADLMAFRLANSDVLDTWDEMIQEYNSAVDSMKLAYQKAAERDDGISKNCGAFKISRRREINVEKLRSVLYEVGASAEDIASIITTKYAALKEKYEAGISRGIITPEIADLVETYTVTVSAPKMLGSHKT